MENRQILCRSVPNGLGRQPRPTAPATVRGPGDQAGPQEARHCTPRLGGAEGRGRINTLSLQEAKDSSAIENIITTHDDLYRSDDMANPVHERRGEGGLRLRARDEGRLRHGPRDGADHHQRHPGHAGDPGAQSGRLSPPPRHRPEERQDRGSGLYAAPELRRDRAADGEPRALHQRRGHARPRSSREDGRDPSPVRDHPSLLRREWPDRTDPEHPIW